MAPHSNALPGESHGWRSLEGAVHGIARSQTHLRLHFHFSLSCIGEGNGSPLRCSCLENPRDGAALWLPSVGSHRVGHNWSDLAVICLYNCNLYTYTIFIPFFTNIYITNFFHPMITFSFSFTFFSLNFDKVQFK